MKKRVLSFILALMLIFSSVPVEPVFAETASTLSQANGTFTISAGGIVSGYSDSTATEIIVPATINDITVTQIAAGAFDGSKFGNLKSVAVLGANVKIGTKAFGYAGSSRVDGFKVWGSTGSTAETYANQNALLFGTLATSITDLTSSQEDLSQCFVGGNAIYVSTIIGNSGSEDIIWTSEDSSLVSITPYTLQTEGGQWVATAQVKVLALSDTKNTCKVYATTRSGFSKELELTLAKPATEVNLGVEVYSYDEDAMEYIKETPPSTFLEDTNIYVDTGYFVRFIPDCGDDNDDSALYSLELGTTVFGETVYQTIDGQPAYLVEIKKPGDASVNALTASGQVLKQYTVHALQPAISLDVKLDGALIGNGMQVVQGFTGKLTPVFKPGTSTDTVTWTSNNSIVQISSDGTVNTTGYGNAEITCTVNDAKSMPRSLSKTFYFYVSQRYNYNQIAFIDNVTDKNVITEANIAAGTSQQMNIIDPTCTESSKTPNETITWSTSDSTIATITKDGILTTKANKNGLVKVTARADSGVVQTLNVNVYVETTKITPEASSYQIPQGQTVKIPYTMTPSNTGESVTWISDDPTAVKVIGVEADANTAGNYILTLEVLKVTDGFIDINGKSSVSKVSSQIQVKGLTAIHANNISLVPENYVRIEKNENGEDVYCVEKDSNFTITANVTPSNYNDTLTWTTWSESSTKPVSCSVVGNIVTANAKYTGKVKFTCESSGGCVATCNVRVIVSATSVKIFNEKNGAIDIAQTGVDEAYNAKARLSTSSTDSIHWSVVSGDASAIKFSKETAKSDELVGITASKAGSYVVRATADSGKYADLVLNAVIKTTSLDFMKDGKKIETLLMVKGEETRLSLANILPANTSDTKYNWEEVKGLLSISASADGKTATVTALSNGTTTIKVTAASGANFTLDVTVLIPAETLKINEQDNPETITVNKGGGTVSVYANLTPNETGNLTNDRVTWTVDKEGIVKLTQVAPIYGPKQQIQIQGLEVGTVVITATTISGLSKSITVEVKTIDIAGAVVTVPTQTYSGTALKPAITSVKVGGVSLKNGTDYEITSYSSNVAAGTGKITLKGINKYSGTKTATFTINPKTISSTTKTVTYTYTNSVDFTGSNVKPKVVVKDGDKTLVSGTDYTVTYPTACANIGTYKLKIEYKGNYKGSVEKSYKVVAKSAAGFTIKNKDGKTLTTLPSKTYTTKAITQTFYVYDGSKKLTEGTDYIVKYTNNINAGTAVVKISGKGNYSSTTYKEIKFTIKPYSLANVKVTAIPDKTYTGSELKPAPEVKRKLEDGTYKKLYAGTDYKVTYSNNKNPGKATIKLTAGTNGNYTSSKSVSFKILPKKVIGVKQSSASQSSVTLSWTKSTESVSGYAVYKYDASKKKYTYLKSTTGTKITLSGLSSGSTYIYSVCAYKKVGTTTKYYSDYSSNVTTYTVPKAATPSLSSASQSVTVKWSKVQSATKYYVYYSTDGGKTYKKAGTSTGTSYTIRSLTKGKKVYVKLKSAKTIAGTEYLSSYSSSKSITVK